MKMVLELELVVGGEAEVMHDPILDGDVEFFEEHDLPVIKKIVHVMNGVEDFVEEMAHDVFGIELDI